MNTLPVPEPEKVTKIEPDLWKGQSKIGITRKDHSTSKKKRKMEVRSQRINRKNGKVRR